MLNDIQLREVFHFFFLERLLKVSDPGLYVLKGGVNLRFFFNSPRYSEDMDLDVLAGNVATLKKNGYKVLHDGAFVRSLRTFGIESIEINDPEKAKHTQTTQRFRVGLVNTSGVRLPSKVEFSRRAGPVDESETGLINPEIARLYRRLSFRCQHYPGEVAALHKVQSLAGRSETQARDVFDLGILHAGGFTAELQSNPSMTRQLKQQAVEAMLSLNYDDFAGQVLEFLDADQRALYNSQSAWEQLQHDILALLDHA